MLKRTISHLLYWCNHPPSLTDWSLDQVDQAVILFNWVQLASYLERGPLMWMMPLHLYVNQKSDYDDDMKFGWTITYFDGVTDKTFIFNSLKSFFFNN